MKATLYGPGEGEHLAVGASTMEIKANEEQTGATLFLSESVIEPGFPGPPPHIHHAMYDMFYVLEGTLTLRLGDGEVPAGPGTFACAPPGVVHTFRNAGDVPVRFLNFSTPGGFEKYMRELSAELSSGREVTSEAIGEIASRHDVHLVTS